MKEKRSSLKLSDNLNYIPIFLRSIGEKGICLTFIFGTDVILACHRQTGSDTQTKKSAAKISRGFIIPQLQ